MKKILNKILFKCIELIEKIQYRNVELDQDDIYKKINNITFVSKEDIYVDSPEGWVKVEEINETQPYKIHYIKTELGKELFCADNHILFDSNEFEVLTADLNVGDIIMTKDGLERIIDKYVYSTSNSMIDLSVDSPEMRYYTNDILSHNTITAAITLLHYCIFNTNKGVMIVANKGDTVVEILDKIKNIYRLLPFFLKPGIINWNSKSIVFDNGCRMKSQARSKEPAIGFTIDFLYMDEFAHIPRNIITHYYKAAIPTVSSIKGSKIVITSTPNGANLFKDLVMGAQLPDGHPDKNMYKLIKVLWSQVPDGKFTLKDGTEINGTRLDPKLYFKHEQILKYGFTNEQLLNHLTKLNFICKIDEETTDNGIKYFIKVLHKPNVSDIDIIRGLDIDGVPIQKLFYITNWKEQEMILIGGEENFNQEYNIQFIAGSKRILSANKSTELDKRAVKYTETDLYEFSKFKFDIKSVRFSPDFNLADINKYYWVTATDMGEGLGQDYSVINGARLMVRDEEYLQNNDIKTLYDAFYLKQTFVVMDNQLNNKTLFTELYYNLHFNVLNPNRIKAVLELNGPADGMLGALPGVNDGYNNFGKYIFAKFKQKPEDKQTKLGYKVTRNKKELVKQYIDSIESDKLYIDDEETIEQMANFIKVETPSGDVTYRSDSGHDDIVMTNVGFANYMLTQDFKNLCQQYFMELPKHIQILIMNNVNGGNNTQQTTYVSRAIGQHNRNYTNYRR